MKCPVCKAKLMPVQGDLFCLQCGQVVHDRSVGADEEIQLEETTDPLLRRAVNDAIDAEMDFVKAPEQLPVAAVKQPERSTRHTFAPLWAIMNQRQATAPAARPQGPVVSPPARVGPGVAANSGIMRAWLVGSAGLAVFLGLNFAVNIIFADRVYPGVRVGTASLGMLTYADLDIKLPKIVQGPKLTAQVDGKDYNLELGGSAGVDLKALEEIVKAQGKNSPVPLVGLIFTWFAPAIQPNFTLSDAAINGAATSLADKVDRAPSDALPTTLGKSVVLIADKSGVKLDQKAAATAIKSAYSHNLVVLLTTSKVKSLATAASYSDDLLLAQAITTTSIDISVKSTHYTPTAEQISTWLVFNGPGKGVQVNPGAVASYVALIPGKFDKAGTYLAVLAALNSHKSVSLSPVAVASTIPAAPNLSAKLPLTKFTYCVDDKSAELSSKLRENLNNSWGLSGRLGFEEKANNCNLAFHLADQEQLASFDPVCAKQTSCRIHNDLVISSSVWAKPPSSWRRTVDEYRTELINHVLGQWLGFEHAGCDASASSNPVLSDPTVIIPGCSPKWYAVPVEMQDTKVLPGFTP